MSTEKKEEDIQQGSGGEIPFWSLTELYSGISK